LRSFCADVNRVWASWAAATLLLRMGLTAGGRAAYPHRQSDRLKKRRSHEKNRIHY